MPVQGFSSLQGNDGNIRRFTVDSIALETSIFPRAHTCFNRIDLPQYKTQAGTVAATVAAATALQHDTDVFFAFDLCTSQLLFTIDLPCACAYVLCCSR